MRILLSILFFTILSSANSLHEQSSKTFSEEILRSLVKHDKDLFEKTAIASKTILDSLIIQEFPKLKNLPKEEREVHINKVMNYDMLKSTLLKSWDKIYNRGVREGIKWENVTLIKIEYEFQEKKGLIWSDNNLYFNFNKKVFHIKLDDCVLLDGHWYMNDTMKWRGEVLD